MDATGLAGVAGLDSGCDGEHMKHNKSLGLLATASRRHTRAEPRGWRDVALSGPAALTVSPRKTMPHRNAVPATAALALDAGIYVREVNGHRIFLGISEDGSPLPGYSVSIGDQTDDDVIVALADVVYPSCRLRLMAGGAEAPPTSLRPRAALRLAPAPPRSPRR